jgi:hypothetical protein
VKLVGDIHFPNLDFEYSQINFGCILNDTTKTMMTDDDDDDGDDDDDDGDDDDR